jgi:hypothetical protein
MENVRQLLYEYNPRTSLYIGNQIMSRRALEDLVEKVFPKRRKACGLSESSVDEMTGISFTLQLSQRRSQQGRLLWSLPWSQVRVVDARDLLSSCMLCLLETFSGSAKSFNLNFRSMPRRISDSCRRLRRNQQSEIFIRKLRRDHSERAF